MTADLERQTRLSQSPSALLPQDSQPGADRRAMRYMATLPTYVHSTPPAPPKGRAEGQAGAEGEPIVQRSGQTSPETVARPATNEAEAPLLTEGQRQIAGAIRRALIEKRAFVALTGMQGVGKTTVLAAVAASPGLPLREISISKPGQVTADTIAQIEQVVCRPAGLTPGGERPTALIVDDAHEASAELLSYLTRVALADRLSPRSPQIILIGRPELWDRLAHDEFAPLVERLNVRPVVQPMTEAEARGLVRHLLDQPRKVLGQSLTEDAERELLDVGQGKPARIKALVRSLLMLEDLRTHPPVPVETVRSAAAWVDGVRVEGVRQEERRKRPGAWMLALIVAVAAGGGVALTAGHWPPDRVLATALDVANRAAQWRTPPVADAAPVISPPALQDGADVPAAGGGPSPQSAPLEPSQVEQQGEPSALTGDPPPLPGPPPIMDGTTIAETPEPEPVTTAAPSPEPPAATARPDAIAVAKPGAMPGNASSAPLPPGMIAMLLRRGDEMLALGDVSTARRYYERTVRAGSALGARGVAGTYDPIVLGREGTAADRAEALAWYGVAAALGDVEADTLRRRLEEGR